MKRKLYFLAIFTLLCLCFTAVFSACSLLGGGGEHAHDMTYNAQQDATCVHEGKQAYYYCKGCKKYFTDEQGQNQISAPVKIPETEHEWLNNPDFDSEDVAATCMTTGKNVVKCANCPSSKKIDTPIDPTNHFDRHHRYVIDEPATCTDTGTGHYQCRCGVNFASSVIQAKGHDIVTDERVEPDCTKTGLTEGSHCTRCEEATVAQTVIPADGHTIVTDKPVAPTCTKKGLTEGSHCGVCDETLVVQTEVAALGHTAVTDKPVAPTCTETGLTEGSHCDVCNETLVEQTEVDALGHTAVTDKLVAPTCTEKGLTEGSHCGVCDETLVKQTEVAALGHTAVTDKPVAPTCTETGLTEGSHCDVCDETLVVQTEVPANGHTVPHYTHDYIKHFGSCSVCQTAMDKEHTFDSATHLCACGRKEYSAGLTYAAIDGNTAWQVTGLGTCEDEHVVIPYEHEGKPVKSVAANAFAGEANLSAISLPHTLDSIGNDAFATTGITQLYIDDLTAWLDITFDSLTANPVYQGGTIYLNNTALTELIFQESVTIPAYAFAGANLTKVTFPYYYAVNIGSYAFKNCTANMQFGANHSLTLADYALADSGVTNLTLNDSGQCTDSFGERVIDGCAFLKTVTASTEQFFTLFAMPTESNGAYQTNVWLPSLTEVIISAGDIGATTYRRAFMGQPYIQKVTLPNATTHLPDYMFANCAALTQVNLPASLITVGNNAFENCTSLQQIALPDTVTSLGDYAFKGAKLQTLTFPTDIQTIGNGAFENCSSLTVLHIPQNVTLGAEQIFANGGTQYTWQSTLLKGCTALEELTLPNFNAKVNASPDKQNYTNWSTYDRLGFYFDSVNTATTYPNLKTLTLLNTNYIRSNAFVGFTGIQELNLPASVSNIDTGNHAEELRRLTNLKVLTVASSNANYTAENNVLYNKNKTTLICYAPAQTATSFAIPESVTTVQTYAFANTTNLQTVTVSANVTAIGAYAFYQSGIQNAVFTVTAGWNNGVTEQQVSNDTAKNAELLTFAKYALYNDWTRN